MIVKSYSYKDYQNLGSYIFTTIALFLEGKTVTEICNELNLSRSDVYKILKDNNYSLKPKKTKEVVAETVQTGVDEELGTTGSDNSYVEETTEEAVTEGTSTLPLDEVEDLNEVQILEQFEEELTQKITKNNFSDLENVDEEEFTKPETESVEEVQEEKTVTELDILKEFEESPNKLEILKENKEKLNKIRPSKGTSSDSEELKVEENLEESTEDFVEEVEENLTATEEADNTTYEEEVDLTDEMFFLEDDEETDEYDEEDEYDEDELNEIHLQQLYELYESEPNDLTFDELEELREAGMIDGDYKEETEELVSSDREEFEKEIEELFESKEETPKETKKDGNQVFLEIVGDTVQEMTNKVSNIFEKPSSSVEEKATEEVIVEPVVEVDEENIVPTIPYRDSLSVKSYEILTKNLLEEKGINYKFLKTDRRIKFTFNDVEYTIIYPCTVIKNGVEKNYNNPLEVLYKINSIVEFNNFEELINNINFFSNLKDNSEIYNFQVKLLLPNRQKTLWFESCYVDLEGAILDLEIYGNRYVFALEETQIEIRCLGEKTKNMKFNTSITEEERLRRNSILSDESFELNKDAYVLVYRNDEVIDKIRTCEILSYVKENLYE